MIQNFKASLLFGAFSVMTLAPMSYAADSPQDVLQQGIMAQTGERDFNKAVDLYRKAIQQAVGTPDVAARAELQLGLCYEAMNQPNDAVPAFHAVENLASEKSPEILESARTHLQRLENQLSATAPRSKTSTLLLQQRHPYLGSCPYKLVGWRDHFPTFIRIILASSETITLRIQSCGVIYPGRNVNDIHPYATDSNVNTRRHLHQSDFYSLATIRNARLAFAS